jgi:hypothetical protein
MVERSILRIIRKLWIPSFDDCIFIHHVTKFHKGTEVYFYKPPSAVEAERKGWKAKHMDHYAGPATIIRKVGTRSFLIE